MLDIDYDSEKFSGCEFPGDARSIISGEAPRLRMSQAFCSAE